MSIVSLIIAMSNVVGVCVCVCLSNESDKVTWRYVDNLDTDKALVSPFYIVLFAKNPA